MAIDKSDPRTRRLIDHWVRGEGAEKIGWGTDGAFEKCTRALSGKVRDPKGLCAELHKEATGEWPAEEGVESALREEAFHLDPADFVALEDIATPAPKPLIRWRGLIAPVDRPTGDGREFATGALNSRNLPLPAMFQRTTGSGHGGAVTVASLDRFTQTAAGWEGEGEFLDPRIVPEVTEAIYLIKRGLARPSVDLEPRMTYAVVPGDEEGESTFLVTDGTVAGVTFVAKPAFADLEITVYDTEIAGILASVGIAFELVDPEFASSVNAASWRSMPLGERDQPFDADDAIKRLIDASGGKPETFAKAFLWHNPQGDPRNRDTYRLPIADVLNGKMTLVPHAVYAAAALLSGAHGGLPNIPDDDKEQIRKVVTEIYDHLRDTFADPRIKPMWQRGGRDGAEGTGDEGMNRNEASLAEFGVRSGWSGMPMADASRAWDGPGATRRLWAWADGDLSKFGRAFLWSAANPQTQADFKLPIADLIDGTLTIVPRALNAVPSVLAGGRGGVDIPAADKTRIQGIVQRLQKRAGIGGGAAREEMTLTASGAPLRPPTDWFLNPRLDGPTPLRVEDSGEVYGHLAQWGVCHTGIGNSCALAPHSAADYAYFKSGYVVTAEGHEVPVGKITLGGGHATLEMGYIPALEHYDDAGTAVAVVTCGEDDYGVWVAGSLCPEVPEGTVAELRRSPLSGDWRRINGNLELIAALAVNTPGYPVLRASAEPDELEAIVAAGVIPRSVAVDFDTEARHIRERLMDIDRFVRAERWAKVMED